MADGSRDVRLPSSNRGVSEFRKPARLISVGIDWFAASVDLRFVLEEQGWEGMHEVLRMLDETGANALKIAHAVLCYFFAGCGMTLADEAGKGRFYTSRVGIKDAQGNHVGLIEMGGSHTIRKDNVRTARIELTGDGCRLYSAAGSGHAKRWLELQAKLESCAGRITRCDVAADDLDGEYPVHWAMQLREEGAFDNRGQRPKGRLYDDMGSGDGKTFYVGTATSEKQLRVYEKGRELGDKESPWVRYEAQFKASNRKELPLDMLRDPAGFLLGAYPVLRFIDAMASRIDVTSAAAIATWKSCRRHLRRQYGATLAFICKNTPDDESLARVIRTLTSPKQPAWASKEAAENWPEIVAINNEPQRGV
jgi:phage replication initiation protein